MSVDLVRQRPFVVIGMGRSGTSYGGSILADAGLEMGSRLKPADERKIAGYFEDLDVLEMHERWLARRGLTFGSIHSFPLDTTDDEEGSLPPTSSAVTRQVCLGE
jgi:hypothetical protein